MFEELRYCFPQWPTILPSFQRCAMVLISSHPCQHIFSIFFIIALLMSSFDLHFSNDWWCWVYFYVSIGYSCISGERSVQILCTSSGCLVFWLLSFRSSLFWILIPYHIYDLQIFSSVLWAAFNSVDNVLWFSYIFILVKFNPSIFFFGYLCHWCHS